LVFQISIPVNPKKALEATMLSMTGKGPEHHFLALVKSFPQRNFSAIAGLPPHSLVMELFKARLPAMNPAAPDGAPRSGSVPVSIWVNTALTRRASKEALRRESIMPWFIDVHYLRVNTLFMSVSPETIFFKLFPY
jgi:hypothetical protein